MTKQEVSQMVLQDGKSLSMDKFSWDENARVFSTIECRLVLDFRGVNSCVFNAGHSCTFKTGYGCTFNTGYDCTFKTEHSCTFNTGYDCTFKTEHSCTFKTGSVCVVVRRDVYEVIELEEGVKIKLNGYGIKGYKTVVDNAERANNLVEQFDADPMPNRAHLIECALDEAYDRGVNCWVNVADRLPKENTLVIVEGGVARYFHNDWYSDTGHFNKRIMWEVTKWMPLPTYLDGKMLTTTLNRIKECSPCESGWKQLLKHLGKTKADDDALPYSVIVKSNGMEDAIWCCRCEPKYAREWRLYAVWCARQVEHLMGDASRNALDVAERFANGEADIEELKAARDAAWDAARDAAWDAASYAAGDASYAADRAAALAAALAARDAAMDARDKEERKQKKQFLKIVKGE